MSKVLCINDAGRPNEVKPQNWIKKGEVYTVEKLMKTNVTGDYYFELEEINPNCPPYMGYNVKRFLPVELQPELNEEMEYQGSV